MRKPGRKPAKMTVRKAKAPGGYTRSGMMKPKPSKRSK